MTIEEIFENYHIYIYNYALKLTCHPQTAEDLTSDTFMKAFQNLSSLKDNSAIKAWLRKICLNTYFMQLRKDKINIELLSDEIEVLEQDGILFNSLPTLPEDEILVAESIKDLQNGCFLAMARRLTLQQRICFSLIDMFGLSIEEVACILSLTKGAVKGLLYRARMNLDSFFAEHCEMINVENPCSCQAWINFSQMHHNNQQEAQQKKLIHSLDYTQKKYQFNPSVRAKIQYLYAHMPEKKPSKDWYHEVTTLIGEFYS